MVTIAASRVWALNTQRRLLWTSHAPIAGGWPSRGCGPGFVSCKGAGYPCLCRDLGFPLVATGGRLLPAVAGLVLRWQWGIPLQKQRGLLLLPALRYRWSCLGNGLPYRLYPLALPPTIGCRSLHRRVSQTNPEIMVQYRCHPPGGQRCRIRIRKWWLCLPGPLRVLGSSGGLHRVPNPQGWTIGFSGWPALVLRGYTEVPPVERSVAIQLCPRTASTWRGNPLLTGSAYAACGEAASALHAMALLQVHQAKALRDLHEGGHDPGVLSELRTATDLALRATKVTARSLGRAMSTMVVQELHLWLCLADMKEVDKERFLNAPVSQTGLFGDAVENFAQQFSAAQKQTEAIRHILPRRAAAASTRPPAAVPRSTRRRGRPPAAGPAPAQLMQQPPAKQRRGAGRRAAAPPVQAPAKPGGKCRSKRPWDGRPRDGDVCSSGDGERTTPSPGGGPGGESFVSFSATGLTVSGTQNLDKRAVSSISGSPEGTGGCERVKLELHSPSSLASGQLWAVREGGQSHYSRTLCQNAGKCITHADPASDRQRDTGAGSLRSPSLPHRGYVSGFVGVTSMVLGGLASAPQPISLAPPYHQTRLCDSVRPATS